MILKYVSDNKSVKRFADIEIEDFVVLTGKNGSGKTHFLDGIKSGKIKVDDIELHKIVYFNYSNFEVNFQTTTDYSHKNNAWNRLNQENNNDLIFQLKKEDILSHEDKDKISKIAKKVKKPIFELNEKELSGEDEYLNDKLNNYKNKIKSKFDQENYINDDLAESIYDSVILKSTEFITEIKQSEFISLFSKTAISGKRTVSDLSNIFLEYYRNTGRNQLNKANGKEYLSNEKFISKFGNPPWEAIREILDLFSFGFDINDPEGEGIDHFEGHFRINFINKNRGGIEVPFDDLSSGEKILITLVNSIYTSSVKANVPELVLLDEVDGPLNPSIIQKFINYLKNSFSKRGVKVIITTHSPSTVAFAPDEAVYLVDTAGISPLRRSTSNEAIKSLSEGFVTLTDLLELNTITSRRVIISEGKNYKYLEKAKDLCGIRDLAILHIFSLGASNLRVLFDFIRRFNNEKEFIFVWDHDYRFKSESGVLVPRALDVVKFASDKKNKTYIFQKNEESSITNGIENLFSGEPVNTYAGMILSGDVKNKDEFAKHIISRNNKNDFNKFSDLFRFIESTEITNL